MRGDKEIQSKLKECTAAIRAASRALTAIRRLMVDYLPGVWDEMDWTLPDAQIMTLTGAKRQTVQKKRRIYAPATCPGRGHRPRRS